MAKLFLAIFVTLITWGATVHAQISTYRTYQTYQSGEVGMISRYTQKPSSKKDNFNFKMPEARWNVGVDLDDDLNLDVQFIYAKSRNPPAERWSLQVERAYMSFSDLGDNSLYLQYGLVPLAWVDCVEQYWPYRTSTLWGTSFTERFGYMSRSDLGIKIAGDVQEWAEWSLALVNGEGSASDETGTKKDLHLTLQGLNSKGFIWAASLVSGEYENLDSSISKKQRGLFYLAFEKTDEWLIFAELMMAKDAADGVDQKLADQVDLTDQSGQSLLSSGGSVGLRYKWRPLHEVFIRHDRLNPAQGVDAKGLRQSMLGFGFFPRQNLQFSLAWGDVQYERDHVAFVKDASEVVFSTLLKW